MDCGKRRRVLRFPPILHGRSAHQRSRANGSAKARTIRAMSSAQRTSTLLASKLFSHRRRAASCGRLCLSWRSVRHPWLLDEHLEEIANLHLEDADCCRIRKAMLTVHQTEELLDNEKLLEHLSRGGCEEELERLERLALITLTSTLRSGANKEQVLVGWRHVMEMHGKAGVPRSVNVKPRVTA